MDVGVFVCVLLYQSVFLSFVFGFCFCFCFLGPHLWHMEVSIEGAESELQLPAYTTAIAMQNLSHICDLHHSSQQRWIPDPLKHLYRQGQERNSSPSLRLFILSSCTNASHMISIKKGSADL